MTPERYVQTSRIKEAVVGHELAVLEAMGISWPSGRSHTVCPYPNHGGDNDWRWDCDNACAICTCRSWHSIFDVVSTCKDIDFEAAKILVAEIIGRTDLIQQRGGGPRHQKTDAASLLSASAENRDDTLPRNYLAFRLGIEPTAMPMPRTRAVGIKSLGYFDPPTTAAGKPKLAGTFPCAVFEMIDAMGSIHAHRIYLALDGQGKADLGAHRDPKKSARVADGGSSTAGRSVIWGDPATASHIIVCEGIETGAAVAVAMREEIKAGTVVVAAAISAVGVEAFRPWPATTRITVAADRDEKASSGKSASRRGEIAARKLGIAFYDHVPVTIALPGAAGEKIDWLDVFQRDGAEAVRIGMMTAEPFVPTTGELSDAVSHRADAAELDEITAAYPLPALANMQLSYQPMPDGDIWVHKIVKIKAGGETSIPVSSPVGVVAMLRYADRDDAYGLRVAVQDMGGQTRLVDFNRADLARMNGAEIKAVLFEAGLRVEADGENTVVALLKAARPTRVILVVSRTGWHRLGTANPIFVAPSGEVIGLPEGQDLELSTGTQLRVPAITGSLDDWRVAVETVVSGEGCPHWLIGIVAGFVGPILGLTGLDACGINLSGMSTAGKTTAQRLAVSPWSSTKVGDGLLQSMRATENAVEGLSQRANGTVLCLDEVSHIDGKIVARLIYSVAGGVGKARMTAGATLKTPYSWNTFAVFSGECSLEEKVRGDGGQWLAGMAVRFPDIDVTGVNRHAEQSVLDAIDTVCRNHGHAGPAFVKALIEAGIHHHPDQLREHVNQAARKLAGPDADGALVRAATSFALMVVAGDLAKQLGLLPAAMDVGEAVKWTWDRFRASTDAVALNPEDQVIGNINRWLAERWDVTIRHVGASSGTREATAWYDNDTVYLPAERLREAAGGALKQVEIARVLDKRKVLARRTDAKRLTVKYIPKQGNVQAYALSRSHFGCSPNISSDAFHSMQDRRRA